MTFSLLARCATTGRFGMVISSSSPAVAARCAHARAGVGVAATQNITDPTLGPRLLDLMAAGHSAHEAMSAIVASAPHIAYRQLLCIDAQGRTALHSGAHILGTWNTAQGPGCVAGGNLLAHDGVPQAMVDAFAASSGTLGDRLIAALRAGRDAGGEAGPVHSAGLLMVDADTWPCAELRCDWVDDTCPIEAVARAWQVYAPQMPAYLQRARDPREAPSYGVPGNE
ncbi:DUF1028 domain-containing protein [Gemmobacter aquarius]|uniref:DUF1028 domain-containing protein n=1 Tax=Paragemmobacter aquarius TaxID=2169400 RepID=A0A2S0UNR2_9RHOB|nr:DUF1028 domain-containing protein [Gemmobacter aquarius]AWB49437.1 DUF1028 domain-containing protein [Gemmobacter aquarius]